MAELSYADVQARATELGITPVIGKNRKFLEAAIASEEKRRADEAAADPADQASNSGAGTGDVGTPGEDPAAAATGEPGSSPATPPPPAPEPGEQVVHEITATKIGGVEAWVCTCGFRTMADAEIANTHAARA